MDREEEISRRSIGARYALEQALPGLPIGDQQNRLGKACMKQFLLDELCEPEVEFIFVDAARADSAGGFSGVPDIDHDPERRPIASHGRFLARAAGGTGPAGMPRARRHSERSDHGGNRSNVAEEGHQTYPGPLAPARPNRTWAGLESSLQ